MVEDISAAIRRLGQTATVALLGSMMKGVDITTSNVPGPPFPVWIAGSRVDEFFAFGPLAGAAVNLTLFSYDGTLCIGINSDKVAITEPDRFVACIEAGLADVAALADRDGNP
jgi:diacylglycerol O-acyltransferase